MKDSVVIKSNKYGLTLVLNDQVDFETLVRDICTKFAKSRAFFGETEMILSYEGRDVSGEESAVIVEAIELNSDVKIPLISENNKVKDVKMQKKIDKFYFDNIFDNAKIIRGSVGRKSAVCSDQSLVVLGDVKAGATVQAAGNIIIFGSLEGHAIAGYPEENSCYIVTNELNTDHATIGTCSGTFQLHEKWSLRLRKKNQNAMAIVVWDKELLCEPLSGGILKQIKS